MRPPVVYTCTGSVRGNCGHNHRLIEGAVRCCKQDSRSCKAQGGYSDRAIYAVEKGVTRPLDEQEHAYATSDVCDRRTSRA